MNSIITQACRLHGAGEHDQALDLLTREVYDHGLTDELHAELQRLFPATPEVLQQIAEYDRRLADADSKARQKTARQISRMALGELSNSTFHFLRHPEATALLTRHLASGDPVVQEQMTIALGMAFSRYTRDERAFEPLVRQLGGRSATPC